MTVLMSATVPGWYAKTPSELATAISKLVVLNAPAAITFFSFAFLHRTLTTWARWSGEKFAVRSANASTFWIGCGPGRDLNSGFSGCKIAMARAVSTVRLSDSGERSLLEATPTFLP